MRTGCARPILQIALAAAIGARSLPVAAPVKPMPTVAVLALASQGVDSSSALVLTDALSDELHRSGKVRVMERSQMAGVLKEQGFQQSGACDGSECAVQAGRLLGIQKIVVGSLGRFGNSYTVQLRGVDVGSGEILCSVRRVQRGELDAILTDLLPKLARELAARLAGEQLGQDDTVINASEAAPLAATRPSAGPRAPAKVEGDRSGRVTDGRDGHVYRWIRIGGRAWLAENLDHSMGNSWCYENKPENCRKWGRLYDWATARRACLEGWHLPSDVEWTDLERSVCTPPVEPPESGGCGTDEGSKLKAAEMKGGDAFGFSVLPAGYRAGDGTFTSIGVNANFWSSTGNEGSHAGSRYFDLGNDYAIHDQGRKTYGYSVRCVRD